jgi:hypothetical protein
MAVFPVSLLELFIKLHQLKLARPQFVLRDSDILLNILYVLETTSIQSGFNFGIQGKIYDANYGKKVVCEKTGV